MTIRHFLIMAVAASASFGWTLVRPGPVAAHCDSMDGPVVAAARSALEAGVVEPVLGWVRARDEAEIRAAFARTLKVRTASDEAKALADLWFFETVVRIHRQGEGEPYTGLKPAGEGLNEGIAAADEALKSGSIDGLARSVGERVADAIRDRFEAVRALADYDARDVAAARAWVQAYVEYVHLLERIIESAGDTGHPIHLP